VLSNSEFRLRVYKVEYSSVPTLVEQKQLVIGIEVFVTLSDCASS